MGGSPAGSLDLGTWECGACGHLNRAGQDPSRENRAAESRTADGGTAEGGTAYGGTASTGTAESRTAGRGIAALTCEACGVARRYLDDPPLDLPQQPALSEVPSFWFALGWLLAALLGGVALLSPSVLAATGLGRNFLLLEVATALYAAGSSTLNALWERWFNQVELHVPDHAATGEQFAATLTLVPYTSLVGVSVDVRLLDRFYERNGDGNVTTRSRVLGSFALLRRGALKGRRSAVFEAGFVAPFPASKHSDVMAEISADVLDLLGRFVPALRWNASNLREHGGYVVEATVRVGWVTRRLHRRLIAYYIGEQIHFG